MARVFRGTPGRGPFFVAENSRTLDEPDGTTATLIAGFRDLASEGTFEAVLISSPDRLARHYAYQVLVLEEFQRTGCEVVFLNHAFGETPEERMPLQIQSVSSSHRSVTGHRSTVCSENREWGLVSVKIASE